MAEPAGIYRYAFGAQPFRSYQIELPVRRNDLYEQYVVALESGVKLSLKTIYPSAGPRLEPLAALREPIAAGLLSVIDYGEISEGGDLAVVTECVGTSLRELLKANGSMPPATALLRLGDMARALAVMESRSLPMPVLSPDSVGVRPDGVRLDDYFLPMLFDQNHLPTNFYLAGYSAPELDETGPTSRATIFSLGVVLYEMLTGSHPFSGSARQVIAAIQTRDADLSRVPEQAATLLARMLARDPGARFASLAEMGELLDSRATATGAAISIAMPEGVSAQAPVAAPAPELRGPRLEPLGVNEQGQPEFRRMIDGAVMVLVTGGSFTMGGADGEESDPGVPVTLEAFLIDKFPVTWEQFFTQHKGHDRSCEFCKTRNQVLPSRYLPTPMKSRDEADRSDIERRLGALNDAVSAQGGENIPVSYLTWREMSGYARSVGAELPCEAEWEYANRAGTDTRYPWGNDPDPACAWFIDNSGGVPHPVEMKKPNAWGLHDMNGNTMEMCRDRFEKDIFEMIREGAASVDELREGVDRPGERYSVRGGAYTSAGTGISAGFRVGAKPDLRSEVRGFRCVIRAKNAPEWARVAFGG